MLIGNLRRIYAAYDEDGEDLSALPAKAADEIDRLIAQEQSAKFLDTDNTRQARAIHQTEQLLAQLSALLPTLKGVA